MSDALRLLLIHIEAWEEGGSLPSLAPSVLRAVRSIATDALSKGNSQGKAQP